MLAAKITARAKKDALDDLFKPAMVIVNQVLMEEMTDAPCPSLPKPLNLAKAANYLRQRLRPSDPTDLNFEIEAFGELLDSTSGVNDFNIRILSADFFQVFSNSVDTTFHVSS